LAALKAIAANSTELYKAIYCQNSKEGITEISTTPMRISGI